MSDLNAFGLGLLVAEMAVRYIGPTPFVQDLLLVLAAMAIVTAATIKLASTR